MSHRLTTMKAIAVAIVLAGPVALAGPVEARDLIIIDGPVKANAVDCRGCVKRKAIRENAVSTNKIRAGAVTGGKLGTNAVTRQNQYILSHLFTLDGF